MPKKKTGQRKKAEKQKARQKEIGDKSKYNESVVYPALFYFGQNKPKYRL